MELRNEPSRGQGTRACPAMAASLLGRCTSAGLPRRRARGARGVCYTACLPLVLSVRETDQRGCDVAVPLGVARPPCLCPVHPDPDRRVGPLLRGAWVGVSSPGAELCTLRPLSLDEATLRGPQCACLS